MHFVHVLGHVAEGDLVIDLLKGAAAQVGARHLANEQDQRHRVLFRRMNGDGGVTGTRPAADHGNARGARQLGIGDGHEAGPAFVAAGYDLNVVAIVQGVQYRKVAFSRHTEHTVDTVQHQCIHQGVGGAFHFIVSSRIGSFRNFSMARSGENGVLFHSATPAVSGQR